MKLMEITAGVYFGIFRCVAILQNIYWFLGWGSSMWPTSSLSTPWVSLIPSAAWIVLRGLFFKSLFELISNLHLHSTFQNATKFESFYIMSTLTLSCTVYMWGEVKHLQRYVNFVIHYIQHLHYYYCFMPTYMKAYWNIITTVCWNTIRKRHKESIHLLFTGWLTHKKSKKEKG